MADEKTPAPPATREVNCSPFWSVYRPALDKLLAEHGAGIERHAEAVAGPVTAARRAGMPVQKAGAVAVIGAMGIFEKRNSSWLRILGGTPYLSIKAAINAALDDGSIEELMMVLDSPGGACDGLAETGDLLRAGRAKKPITAYIDGMAASAAYYLAAQATHVVADRTALVGCIGSISWMYDYSEAFKKAGIEPVVFATGEFKGTGVPGTKITDAQKADHQQIIDFFGSDFRDAVVQGRRMDPKVVSKLATGEVWPAPSALENGLIDSVGTFEETLASAGRRRTEAASRRARTRAHRARARSAGLLN